MWEIAQEIELRANGQKYQHKQKEDEEDGEEDADEHSKTQRI